MALGGCSAEVPAPSPSMDDATVTDFVPGPAAVQEKIACPVSGEDFPSNAVTSYPTSPRGSVPAGFVTERVFICLPSSTTLTVEPEELQGDFAPLLAALVVQSDRADGEYVCRAVLEYFPVLWLVNAEGGALDAAWPTTACRQGSGKPETQKATDALTLGQAKVMSSPKQGK